jgi:hypothetical protein
MKGDIAVISEHNIRIHTLTGEFNFDYLFQSIVDVYNNQDAKHGLNSIWDFSKVKNIQKITLEQLKKIVAYVAWKRTKMGRIKTALIVSEKVDFGLARIYEQEMESATQADIHVFYSIEEAIKWINSI